MTGAVAEVAASEGPEPVRPLRIKALKLCDFRAFPNPVEIELGGKNLLVYGENGAGKSSIFQALRDYFALRPPPFASKKNVFSSRPDADFRVEVEFVNQPSARPWSSSQHPTRVPGADARVAEAALRKSCLDYRALLDTNYIHGDRRPNLFDISVTTLLADFSVATEGGAPRTIRQLWEDIDRARPYSHGYSLEPINAACIAFNAGFRTALEALHPKLVDLVHNMLGPGLDVQPFAFNGVSYQHAWFVRDRLITGRELFPTISFNGATLLAPQTFLNEARLSAFALAMYLGARLACVPEGGDRLKLLVLDDVLIGLDHDNRIPILRAIERFFADWQVVILTHDRVWFDMARQLNGDSDQWTWAEIFADGDGGRATPSINLPNGDVVAAALEECQRLLQANSFAPAATSARRAFEWVLKKFCERRRIQVPFTMNPKDNDSELLMNAISAWAGPPGQTRAVAMAPVLADLRMYRAGVLNPQTHAGAPNPSRQEIEGAVTAIRVLDAMRSDKSLK